MSCEEIIGGLIVGVVAIIVWESGRQLWRRSHLRHEFGHLAGNYVVTRKLNPSAREGGLTNTLAQASAQSPDRP